MKRILVPTDFSAYSLKALNYAIELAKKSDSEITLIHVCDLLNSNFSSLKGLIDEHNETLQKELWEKLHKIRQSILETEGIEITLRLYNGNITESIIEEAKKGNRDLIIMGTLGAAGLKEKILGSKAIMVIRHSPVSVLCIPFNYQWSKPKRLLLAINDAPKNLDALQPLMHLCNFMKADLELAVLSEESAEGSDVMAHSRLIQTVSAELEKSYPDISFNRVHLSGAHFYDAILEYIHENNIDLLAMIPHQKKWLQYITGRSMTQKMAAHTDVPLLALNEPLLQS
jgi:nucleotide-binding universal stress UspA family protein